MRDSHGAEGILIAGRYRLIERLGAGGMGRVWRAHDLSLDCDVALKEVWLPPMLSDSERADRLARAQREARNAARLRNHPHIVSVHDMVSDQGLPWIVMDLIPSQNLLQVVEQFGPLPLAQVVKIGLGVLEALTASHVAGILHRDVKPANVLLTTDGRVLLTDFGIAVQESDLTMTSSGVLIGSPEYVAPERARGEASKAGSDLFSLGATLYYAAEGRSPFARETAVGVLTAILFEETAAVTRVPALDPLIRGLLTKDPALRWDAVRTRGELERLGGSRDTRPEGIEVAPPNPFMVPPAGGGPGGSGFAPVGGPAAGGSGFGGPVGEPAFGGGNPFAPPPMYPAPSPPKNNAGRNVGIGVGALLLAGVIVLVVALSGGKKKDDNLQPADHNVSASTSASVSIPSTSLAPPTTSTTSQAPTTDSASASSPPSLAGVDPSTWDKAGTDQTSFTPDSLLPVSFTDSKGVVYTATNRWTDTCVNTYESAQLKGILNKYHCAKQAVGTYTDKDGRILVDVAVLPLADADSVQKAFHDMQNAKAFTIDDWGIWCPKPGAGSDICAKNQDTSAAQQYGYIQPDHRYLVHAVSLYVNLASDPAAQQWLTPAATDGAKQAGPQVAVQ